MKAVEYNLPQDLNESFIVFRERGQYFPAPWHYHEHFELVQVTSSTGRRMVGDHIGFYDKDDLVFLGSNLPHVWVSDPEYFEGTADREADAVVIHFKRNFLGPNLTEIPELAALNKVIQDSARGIVIKGKTRDRINDLMKEMLELNGNERLKHLFAIFDSLARMKRYDVLASPAFLNNTPTGPSDRFKIIMEYIMQNFEQKITLQDMSEVANMSVTSLCNFFKERFRMTFVEYVNSIRIGQACVIMSETDRTIAQIAYQSGFNSLANFNRQFKKYKGMSPSSYRKKIEVKRT